MATRSIYDLIDTWNAAGETFTSIKMTVTDTAFAAGSRLIDITSTVAGGYMRLTPDGDLAITGTFTFGSYIDFSPIAAPAWAEGRLYYDQDRKGLVIFNAESAQLGHSGQPDFHYSLFD